MSKALYVHASALAMSSVLRKALCSYQLAAMAAVKNPAKHAGGGYRDR
mgnify:CR=1 FL=1